MFMHGNKDPLVHIDGGPVLRDRGVAICLAQAAAFWRKLDGTSAQPAFLIEKASHNLDATQTVWDFFTRHTR